jgi:hypothetical protein
MLVLLLVAAGAVASPDRLAAAPVRVRAPEGSAHGFLVLRGTKAEVLAQGDWWQIPSGDRLEVHLRFQFTDGSLSHETFVLGQHREWTLLSYRSVQRGPSFPRDLDGHIDGKTGHYTVSTHDRDKDTPKVDEGELELPEDAYGFGMLAILLRNLEPGAGFTAHVVAFTPKPRILELAVTPDGEDTVTVQGLPRKTSRFLARAKLGGVLGAAASVAGKQPPALHFWIAGDPLPTFVRFDGPFYSDAPIWRVELAAPHWADDARR